MKRPYTPNPGRRGANAVLFALLFFALALPALAEPARNIILLIGDGMGREQVKAARLYRGSNLSFEAWINTADVATASASSPVTDSAAGGTAIATGTRVNNGVVGIQLPGDGHELKNVLEYFKGRGKRTGLVTTAYMTDGTPAAFGAHVTSRFEYAGIAADYLLRSRPNVLFGGGGMGMTVPSALAAGYAVVTNRAEMQALDTATVTNVSGQFGIYDMPFEHDGMGPLPHLSEMTATALAILTNSPAGFFLMAEGGTIDSACHSNDVTKMIPEVLELDNAALVCAAFATSRSDTLMIVTADHETGGLTVLADNGPGVEPTVSWTILGHTGTDVGLWAWGPGSGVVRGFMDNTNTYEVMIKSVLTAAGCSALSNTPASAMATVWTVATGEVYRLEYSGNLLPAAWTALTVITTETAAVTVTDTNAAEAAMRFYRLVALPE